MSIRSELKEATKKLAVEKGWLVFEATDNQREYHGFPDLFMSRGREQENNGFPDLFMTRTDFIVCAYFIDDDSYEFLSELDREWAEALDEAYCFAPGCKVFLWGPQDWVAIRNILSQPTPPSAAKKLGYSRPKGLNWAPRKREKYYYETA